MSSSTDELESTKGKDTIESNEIMNLHLQKQIHQAGSNSLRQRQQQG